MNIEFFVPGIPRPGGSKRFVGVSKKGRGILVDASGKKGKDWRTSIQAVAIANIDGPPLTSALTFNMAFVFPRPKSHYRTGKYSDQLKKDAPLYHTNRPDATKLIRAAEDALTGIVWKDDAQIAVQTASKVYGDKPGVKIQVWELKDVD